MSDSLIHDHCCNLNPKGYVRDLVNKVDFELSPLLFVYGKFEVELNTEGVKLSNFKVVILFGISSFDTDSQSISFGKVIDIYNE